MTRPRRIERLSEVNNPGLPNLLSLITTYCASLMSILR